MITRPVRSRQDVALRFGRWVQVRSGDRIVSVWQWDTLGQLGCALEVERQQEQLRLSLQRERWAWVWGVLFLGSPLWLLALAWLLSLLR